MKTFSDNVIFVDTEFSTLDPYKGEIMSIGLVKPSGEELYVELEYDGECSKWTKENILPKLKGPKIGRAEAAQKIEEFVGNSLPFMVSYVNAFDVIYFYKLAHGGARQLDPFFWIPIDFASMIFAYGLNPENESEVAKNLDIDRGKYERHNALDDARLLKEMYFKLAEKIGGWK